MIWRKTEAERSLWPGGGIEAAGDRENEDLCRGSRWHCALSIVMSRLQLREMARKSKKWSNDTARFETKYYIVDVLSII